MALPALAPYPLPPLPDIQAAPWELDCSRAALLIHDMQQYFINAYQLNQPPIAPVIHNIAALIKAADAQSIPVFFSAQPPQQSAPRRGLLFDVWGQGMQTPEQAAIIPQLAPLAHHHVITKWRYSAFERTDLFNALLFSKRDQLMITGVYGHMGCQVTAADAFMKDIQPFFIGDAVADFSAAEHAGAMQWVAKRCGKVISTQAALQILEKTGCEHG